MNIPIPQYILEKLNDNQKKRSEAIYGTNLAFSGGGNVSFLQDILLEDADLC